MRYEVRASMDICSPIRDHLFNLVADHLLDQPHQRFNLNLQLLKLFLFIFIARIESVLRRGLQLLTVNFLQLMHGKLLHGVNHAKYLKTLLAQHAKEQRKRTRKRRSRQ